MKNTKIIIATIGATLCLVFLLQNTQIVTIPLFFWKIRMARIVWMLVFLVIGFIAGVIAMRFLNKSRDQG